jgi:hypothetical protein
LREEEGRKRKEGSGRTTGEEERQPGKMQEKGDKNKNMEKLAYFHETVKKQVFEIEHGIMEYAEERRDKADMPSGGHKPIFQWLL